MSQKSNTSRLVCDCFDFLSKLCENFCSILSGNFPSLFRLRLNCDYFGTILVSTQHPKSIDTLLVSKRLWFFSSFLSHLCHLSLLFSAISLSSLRFISIFFDFHLFSLRGLSHPKSDTVSASQPVSLTLFWIFLSVRDVNLVNLTISLSLRVLFNSAIKYHCLKIYQIQECLSPSSVIYLQQFLGFGIEEGILVSNSQKPFSLNFFLLQFDVF